MVPTVSGSSERLPPTINFIFLFNNVILIELKERERGSMDDNRKQEAMVEGVGAFSGTAKMSSFKVARLLSPGLAQKDSPNECSDVWVELCWGSEHCCTF